MPHLFISYAKKDTRELALELADKLNEIDGVTAWVDRSLRAGKSWELQIESEIDRCDTMIVLYSPDIHRHKKGKKRSYILNEIAYAQQLEKPVIPIMAQETTPPMALIMEHYIDFIGEDLSVDNLVEVLCSELGIEEKKSSKFEELRQLNSELNALWAEHKQAETLPSKPLVVPDAEAIKAIIGEPFRWCEVPTGGFRYSEDDTLQTLALPIFAMAKYPITYSQYQTFIDDKEGFKDSRWWEGLAQVQSDQPSDQKWKIDNHPRENISWYDAIAFCRWLSWCLGGGYNINRITEWAIRLPTEFEWEKAARGTDGRVYPWGNEFDEHKANTKESGISQTTPVTQYPNGASPYDVLDMSGNVWEWCLTNYRNPQQNANYENIYSSSRRVLRGGSWLDTTVRTRTASRVRGLPNSDDNYIGFRIMRPS